MPLLMQHEVRHASANQAVDLCADLCANSAKRDESDKNQENVTAPVTLITAHLVDLGLTEPHSRKLADMNS